MCDRLAVCDHVCPLESIGMGVVVEWLSCLSKEVAFYLPVLASRKELVLAMQLN